MTVMPRINYDAKGLKDTYLAPEKLRVHVFEPDISGLEEGYRKALPKLLMAIGIVDDIFLVQDHPDSLSIKNLLLRESERSEDAADALRVFRIFNGPEGITYSNEIVPLFSGVRPRPEGGTVYTDGITAQELDSYLAKHPEKAAEFNKTNTIIRRAGKGFNAVPYESEYREQLGQAASLLIDAANDVPSASFAKYLRSRAQALVSGDYFNSDVDFVRSTDSPIDLLIGPLEEYLDRIQSKKAFYSGMVCIKDPQESRRVEQYITYVQYLEDRLPQDKGNAKDMSRINIPVAVVDVIAMSGEFQANRPGMLIGQTLPNDEKILEKVGRKIFIYKNVLSGFKTNQEVMNRLVDPQLHRYTVPASSVNFVVGHEVSHSLGPKISNRVANGEKVAVDQALGFYSGIIEELKSDLLSVYNLPYLISKGLYSEEEARGIAFYGCLSRNLPMNRPKQGKDTHATGNLVKFNYYIAEGAVTLKDGRFYLDFDKAAVATEKMLAEVLSIQSEGNREMAKEFIEKWSEWTSTAKYVSKTMHECGVKLYNEVLQPVAAELLRN